MSHVWQEKYAGWPWPRSRAPYYRREREAGSEEGFEPRIPRRTGRGSASRVGMLWLPSDCVSTANLRTRAVLKSAACQAETLGWVEPASRSRGLNCSHSLAPYHHWSRGPPPQNTEVRWSIGGSCVLDLVVRRWPRPWGINDPDGCSDEA